MPRRVRVRLLTSVAAAVLLAGCGNSRTPVPNLTHPAGPNGFHTVSYRLAGIAFEAPRNWTVSYAQAQPLLTVTSGSAVIAVSRFPLSGRLPTSHAQLVRARQALIRAARAGGNPPQLIRSRVASIAGAPAVVLNTNEQVGSQQRRVRSIHMFTFGSELVLEEYAPPELFHSIDVEVFSPLKRSLALLSPSAV